MNDRAMSQISRVLPGMWLCQGVRRDNGITGIALGYAVLCSNHEVGHLLVATSTLPKGCRALCIVFFGAKNPPYRILATSPKHLPNKSWGKEQNASKELKIFFCKKSVLNTLCFKHGQ